MNAPKTQKASKKEAIRIVEEMKASKVVVIEPLVASNLATTTSILRQESAKYSYLIWLLGKKLIIT